MFVKCNVSKTLLTVHIYYGLVYIGYGILFFEDVSEFGAIFTIQILSFKSHIWCYSEACGAVLLVHLWNNYKIHPHMNAQGKDEGTHILNLILGDFIDYFIIWYPIIFLIG